jgi:hypothetical protein
MGGIRDKGIYTFGGRRYVAVCSPFSGHLLYPEAEGLSGEPRYRVNTRGEVLGVVSLLPAFSERGLRDTGEQFEERERVSAAKHTAKPGGHTR